MKYPQIIGTGSYLPPRVVTNADLEHIMDTTDEWITKRTGIRARHIVPDLESSTSDLAFEAARRALEMAKIEPSALDLIIVGTYTPDYLIPSTACILQGKLGAVNAAAFDIEAACTGFISSLMTAEQFLKTGVYSTALVVGADLMSKFLDWSDRSTAPLFGDGAGAVVLRATKGQRGVLHTRLHSDGAGHETIIMRRGGSRSPLPNRDPWHEGVAFTMQGKDVFKLAVKRFTEVTLEVLALEQLEVKAINLMIPHQANKRIILSVAKQLHIPEENVWINIDRCANTAAATIPIALDEAVRAGRLQENDILVLNAFGAGLSWGASLIRW